jgi:hypothetical protein
VTTNEDLGNAASFESGADKLNPMWSRVATVLGKDGNDTIGCVQFDPAYRHAISSSCHC